MAGCPVTLTFVEGSIRSDRYRSSYLKSTISGIISLVGYAQIAVMKQNKNGAINAKPILYSLPSFFRESVCSISAMEYLASSFLQCCHYDRVSAIQHMALLFPSSKMYQLPALSTHRFPPRTNSQNALLLANNSPGSPYSTILPLSNTTILSKSIIVPNRCATAITVHSLKCSLITLCIMLSVSGSTLLVASSRITMLLFRNIAMPRQRSWRWPWESERVSMSVSRPPQDAIMSQRASLWRVVMMVSSLLECEGSRL
jgi:hypothetical protein